MSFVNLSIVIWWQVQLHSHLPDEWVFKSATLKTAFSRSWRLFKLTTQSVKMWQPQFNGKNHATAATLSIAPHTNASASSWSRTWMPWPHLCLELWRPWSRLTSAEIANASVSPWARDWMPRSRQRRPHSHPCSNVAI